MERGASSSTGARLDSLTDAYRCLVMGSSPGQSAAEVACLISFGVRGLVPSCVDRARSPSEVNRDSSVELSCLALSLVERIASRLTPCSPPTPCSLSPAARRFCVEVLAVLLQDMDLMSHLIHWFQSEDQIISHLAAKTASTCVFHQLQQSGTISPVWQQKCEQAFYRSAPGPELDAGLWSLTEVLKRLLKGAHQDVLEKLLSAFDSSLSALCSNFLPGDRKEGGAQRLVDVTSGRRRATTWCLLLDLLEVLTASGLRCGAGVCLRRSQRITHLRSSALLATVGCSSSRYFVKRRALLLLKRAALQTAGEDWALGEAPLTGPRHQHFHADMNTLARSVLTAVAADWLQSVAVEAASFFGGTRRVGGEEGGGQKPDCVMLRAVSLLLLKSTELHVQTAGATGVDGATEVYGYLQSLWGFLRRCSVRLTEVAHRCCWVSLLFGDQDDDMMEAAKALFSIFLHHRRCSGLDDSAVLEAACASGCNPHCHFLMLLRSISFDHSILLDFLISTETCFLEYFVRYLKYLRADWRGFAAACGRIGSPDRHRWLTASGGGGGGGGGDVSKVTFKGEPDRVEVGSRVQPAAGFHLVEYDSSDQSDPEDMEVSQEEPGPSVFKALDVKRQISGPPVPIGQKQYESSVSKPESTPERRREEPSEQTSCPTTSGQLTCPTLVRAVLCMSELREVVTRLQTKELFPYNPSSLLKLLAQVENCS